MNYILPRKLSAKLRADYIGLLVQFLPNGYAMLIRPNKAETAVHGCHCLGDMAVRMRKVLARPWVGVRVCHLLLLLIDMTAERAVMLVKKVTYFGEFGYLDSSCIRKSIILMFLSSSRDKFTLL